MYEFLCCPWQSAFCKTLSGPYYERCEEAEEEISSVLSVPPW